MKLQRTFLRTIVADGKYELACIIFYNPETQEVIADSNQGWLESGYNDLHKLNLPTCKRKVKLDLSHKTSDRNVQLFESNSLDSLRCVHLLLCHS